MATETEAVTAPQTTPAAAPAAPSSSTNINDQVSQASTPADVIKLAAQLRSNPSLQHKPAPTAPAKPADAKPVQETTAEAATEQSEAAPAEAESTDAAPAAEETAAGDQVPTEDAQGGADGDDDAETDGEGPVTPLTGKRAHLRLPTEDKVGRLAAAMMKRNRDMPMAEAVAKASEQLGIKPVKAESAPQDESTAPSLPKGIQETDSIKNQKLADYAKALSEIRMEDAGKLFLEIQALTEHRFSLERSADKQAVEQEASFNRKFDESHAKATDLYAFAADQNSPGGKRMLEIERAFKDNGDPLYYSASKPLVIAQMVAAELKIAPKAKTQAPAKPAVPAATVAKKGVVPAGGARTTPPPPNAKPPIEAEIGKVKNYGDLMNLRKQLGLRT